MVSQGYMEEGEPRSMELLEEMYARGAGVERNSKALECLTLIASKQQLFSAFNGLGYLLICMSKVIHEELHQSKIVIYLNHDHTLHPT